jgi:hypothetical protein
VFRAFDISNINAIALKAVYNSKIIDFKMDSVTNLVYCLDSTKQRVNIIDLSKYVYPVNANIPHNPSRTANDIKGLLTDIYYSNGILKIRYSTGAAGKPAFLRIYSLDGRMVHQTILPSSQNPSTFSLGGSLPSGIFLLRFTSGEAVQTVKFIARND